MQLAMPRDGIALKKNMIFYIIFKLITFKSYILNCSTFLFS